MIPLQELINQKVRNTFPMEVKENLKGEFLELANFIIGLERKVKKAETELSKTKDDLHQMLVNIVRSLATTIEAKDPYTHGHSERVTKYTLMVAKHISDRYPESLPLETLEYAAILHDIGKIGVPEHVLHKPSRLNEEEFDLVRRHSSLGASIIEQIAPLKEASIIMRHHHERWDGKGYPDELRETKIPIGSRIMAIADTFDAMTSDRPYRKALSQKEAIREIIKNKGKQFDPELVNVFAEVCKEIVVNPAGNIAVTS